MRKIKHILFTLLALVTISVIMDVIHISKSEIIPSQPDNKLTQVHNQMQWELANGDTIAHWERLDPTLEYIKGEYDCSDFRLVNLVRILYEAGDQIPDYYKQNIEDVLFNFRYWWDEPGVNSMCYWSENHQILFASAEYLVGQLYPDTVFPSSGVTGIQHMEKAKLRILDWLEMRWNYGFSEFNSGVYYKEDIGALINLIDFSEDEELFKKSQIVMDLLMYDVALQNIHTMFVSTSGRAYSRNRTGRSSSNLGGITDYYWGDGKAIGPGMMYGMMTSEKYLLPPVISGIAKDSSRVIIKQSNGLNLSELKSEGYYGTDNRSMMMQWGMEAFSNPEIVRNSLAHIRRTISFSNEFVAPLKQLDFTMLGWLHLEPSIMRILNPPSHGLAIQKGNTYTYKTDDYAMYTAQSYHPGTSADQHHIFGLNMKNYFSVFHLHPALSKGHKSSSPNYEVGYGRLPHAVQDKNVSLAIYTIPKKKGMMETELLGFTRAYFPSAKFDTSFIDGNYIFGKKGDTYCAFIGTNNFHYAENSTDDIIQPGKQVFWITEASSVNESGSFKAFVREIKENNIIFNDKTLELTYESDKGTYNLKYKGDFHLDNKVINTDYKRYDSPFVTAERKDTSLNFDYDGHSLFLDFHNLRREFK